MKCNQSRPGFELVSPCPFPTTITIAPRPPQFTIRLNMGLPPWPRVEKTFYGVETHWLSGEVPVSDFLENGATVNSFSYCQPLRKIPPYTMNDYYIYIYIYACFVKNKQTRNNWNVESARKIEYFVFRSHGVEANVLDCNIWVIKFELQSRYYVLFVTNTLGKYMDSLILSAVG